MTLNMISVLDGEQVSPSDVRDVGQPQAWRSPQGMLHVAFPLLLATEMRWCGEALPEAATVFQLETVAKRVRIKRVHVLRVLENAGQPVMASDSLEATQRVCDWEAERRRARARLAEEADELLRRELELQLQLVQFYVREQEQLRMQATLRQEMAERDRTFGRERETMDLGFGR